MQWKVSINQKDYVVQLPDQISDNTPFDLQIAGKTLSARWHRSTRVLYIRESMDTDVWKSIHLRSRVMTRFAGESDTNVRAEFVSSGAIRPYSLDGSVGFYVPGQEARAGSAKKKPRIIRSQITGKVLQVLAKSGDSVQVGDTLLIIEAMKMENRVLSTVQGVVETVKVSEGEMVSSGAELVKFKQS